MNMPARDAATAAAVAAIEATPPLVKRLLAFSKLAYDSRHNNAGCKYDTAHAHAAAAHAIDSADAMLALIQSQDLIAAPHADELRAAIDAARDNHAAIEHWRDRVTAWVDTALARWDSGAPPDVAAAAADALAESKRDYWQAHNATANAAGVHAE